MGVYILFFRETPKEAITAETTYGALDRSIEGSGTTTPTESLTITPVSSAEIKEVFVKAGDMVEVGTLLYTQDDSDGMANTTEYNDIFEKPPLLIP